MRAGYRMFGDAVAHDHPDTTTLTIGCAGCINRADTEPVASPPGICPPCPPTNALVCPYCGRRTAADVQQLGWRL